MAKQTRVIRTDGLGPYLLAAGQCFRPPLALLPLLNQEGPAADEARLLHRLEEALECESGQLVEVEGIHRSRRHVLVEGRRTWISSCVDPRARASGMPDVDEMPERKRRELADSYTLRRPARLELLTENMSVEVTLRKFSDDCPLSTVTITAISNDDLDENKEPLRVGRLSGVLAYAHVDEELFNLLDTDSLDLGVLARTALDVQEKCPIITFSTLMLEQTYFSRHFRGNQLLAWTLAEGLTVLGMGGDDALVVTAPAPMALETVIERDGAPVSYSYMNHEHPEWADSKAALVNACATAGFEHAPGPNPMNEPTMWALGNSFAAPAARCAHKKELSCP